MQLFQKKILSKSPFQEITYSNLGSATLCVFILYSLELQAHPTLLFVNGSGNLNRLLYPFIFLLSCLLLANSNVAKHRLIFLNNAYVPVLILAILMLVGLTVTDQLQISLKRSISQLIVISTIVNLYIVIASRSKVLNCLAYTFIAVVIVNIHMAAYHQEAFDGRGLFQGIYRNKNTAGIIFSLCACLLIQKSIELRSTLYGLFAAVSVCFLLLSQSKTPIIAITIFTTLYIYSKNTQTLMLGRIIFMIFIASVSFSIAAVNGILDKGILTNRGHIWDFVSQSIFQKPIWGYGYAAYWDIGEKSVVNELAGHWVSKMNTAHNGYLELILHFGFFGYFVTLGLVYVCHFYISRVPRKELFCLYVYLAFLLGNNTESYILYYQNPVWVMFLLVSVMSYDMYVSERRTN